MQRSFTYPPYNKWYTYKYNGYSWQPDYTNGKSSESNSLKAMTNQYLSDKYGLQRVYWYTHYHPPTYEEMYWRKWGVRNKY